MMKKNSKKQAQVFLARMPEQFRRFLSTHRLGVFVLGILLFVGLSITFSYRIQHSDDPVKLGVSFSVKYAEELDLDWQTAYLALLDEVQVRHFRLMSYWDLHEQVNNDYNFSDLDWQIDQAHRHGATVSLAVGQRQPRWPECHIPAWVKEVDERTYKRELLEYISVVTSRYKDHPAVESYQVENEAANALFGECPPFDADFLLEEVKLVKRIDPNAVVITNVSNQSGITLSGAVNEADKVGFSIYHNAHFPAFGRQYGWRYLTPSHWHSFRASLISGLKQVPVFVHELQAEPWGPEATKFLSLEEQNKTMNKDQLRAIVEFTKQSGIKEMYLWGGEWWYWRLTEFSDKELWQTAKDIFEESR